jgi:hypothetical protein
MMAEKEEAMHAVLKESVDLVQKITHFSVFNFFFHLIIEFFELFV